MVTGAHPNGLLWTQVANQMEIQPSGGPSGRQLWPAWLKVCLKRADVLSASQRTPSFASLVLQKRKKKGSRIVLKASSRFEKANITTQKRCQSSRQIFGCFFVFCFFYETYRGPGLNCWAVASCSAAPFWSGLLLADISMQLSN